MLRAKLRYSNLCFLVVHMDHAIQVTKRSDFSFSVYFSEMKMQVNIFLEQLTLLREKRHPSPIKMYSICDQIQ